MFLYQILLITLRIFFFNQKYFFFNLSFDYNFFQQHLSHAYSFLSYILLLNLCVCSSIYSLFYFVFFFSMFYFLSLQIRPNHIPKKLCAFSLFIFLCCFARVLKHSLNMKLFSFFLRFFFSLVFFLSLPVFRVH